MANSPVPRADAAFDTWVANYYGAVYNFYDLNGLDTALLLPLLDALTIWQSRYAEHITAQAAAQSATQAKAAARRALIERVLPITRFVQAYPATTNADRAAIGITLSTPRRRATPGPTSRPLVIVNAPDRLTHQLRLVDESTPTRKARPRGVDRAELFVAFTNPDNPAPANPDDYRYLASISDGTRTLTFDTNHAGQQAHYIAKWVNRRDDAGPWSVTTSATVAA